MEMIEHINNILLDIVNLKRDDKYKFNSADLVILKENLDLLKKNLQTREDTLNIDFLKIKEISNILYGLNKDNLFSRLTDHMSNEFYAFEFLLQENLKKKEI
ncbi:MAG: hypothetical protein PHN72_04705 [Bacilli bacterium]|nr:hypothetical protein [Bacilli bacterium]